MPYRQSRNIEASIIEFLQTNLDIDWNNITVEKTFARVYEIPLDTKDHTAVVCVRVGTTDHTRVEIGGNSTRRESQVLIDLFCSDDGQKLDLKDYIIGKIKQGLPYYEYTIYNGQIQSKIRNGRITTLEIEDVPVNFDVDKNALEVHDRYRHLITLNVSIGQVEV